MRQFAEFACFDWSGQAVARPRGIALAVIERGKAPHLLTPDGGWSRADALTWLKAQAAANRDMLIGMDISAGLPFADLGGYFPQWPDSPQDAKSLWALVDHICAGDPHLAANSFVTHAQARHYFRHVGTLGERYGTLKSGRLRIVEEESRRQGIANPYSSLNLVGAAQVGKSGLTGMRVLHRLRGTIPVWPFDPLPASGPAIVEIYTSIAANAAGLPRGRTKIRTHEAMESALARLDTELAAPLVRYDDHSTDALMTAAWLVHASQNPALWKPLRMTAVLAATEGWTFGVF